MSSMQRLDEEFLKALENLVLNSRVTILQALEAGLSGQSAAEVLEHLNLRLLLPWTQWVLQLHHFRCCVEDTRCGTGDERVYARFVRKEFGQELVGEHPLTGNGWPNFVPETRDYRPLTAVVGPIEVSVDKVEARIAQVRQQILVLQSEERSFVASLDYVNAAEKQRERKYLENIELPRLQCLASFASEK